MGFFSDTDVSESPVLLYVTLIHGPISQSNNELLVITHIHTKEGSKERGCHLKLSKTSSWCV